MASGKGFRGLLPHGVALLVLISAGSARGQSAAAAAPVNQGASGLQFAGQAPHNNLFSLGFTASTFYSDNPLNSNPSQGAVSSSFGSHLAFRVTRPAWSADLRYDPQYSYSPDLSTYNSLAHIVSGTFSFRPSYRLEVTLRDSYSHISNPAQILLPSQSMPVFGVTNQINPTGYGQYLDVTAEQAGADINYALSRHSSIGIGGGYGSIQSFQPGNANLFSQDVISWSGHAFYSRQLSRHQTAGLQFQWQRIDSLGGTSQATPMSLQYFHQIGLSRGLSISLFGGPELTNTVDIIPLATLLGISLPPSVVSPLVTIRGRQWAASGGGTLSWSSQRNAASLGFVHQTSGGGAMGGVVSASTASGAYRRQLTAHSALDFSGSYTNNGAINTLNPVPVGAYVVAQAQYSRMLGPVQFSTAYARYQSSQTAANLQPALAGGQNQVSVSLSYSLQKVLGR